MLWVGARGKAADDLGLAFLPAVDHLDIWPVVPRVQVIIQVAGGVGILGKDEHLALLERSLPQPAQERLQLGVLRRGDRFHQGQHLVQDADVLLDVSPQGVGAKISQVVAAAHPGQGVQEGLFFVQV